MEPRRSSVSPLRTRERSRTLGLRKTTLGTRSGRSNGWAECREKKIGIEPMGSTFFLTSPLIGQCYTPPLYVTHFKGGLNSVEAQSGTIFLPYDIAVNAGARLRPCGQRAENPWHEPPIGVYPGS